jgi:hypothetical protein
LIQPIFSHEQLAVVKISRDMKLKTTHFWFLIFAMCFFVYQQIQDNLRPFYDGGNTIVVYLLGVAPNFFPAIGIPALFVISLPYLFKNKSEQNWIIENRHFVANLISIIGLVGWEFIQQFGKLHFDWHYVLWTFIGAACFQFIWTLTPKRLKSAYE